MCQLCLINTKDKELNRLLLFISSQNNAILNDDGFGFFTPSSGIWKTELSPRVLVNLGEIIKSEITTNEPIISHVRKATFTNGVKIKTKEKSHPFETDKLILAHNGQLNIKDNKTIFEVKDKIDSEIFLEKLDSLYTDETDFYSAIKEAMSLFDGKFAFLIYDKIKKEYYVARGLTADLYILTFKHGGFVVNTEKDSLLKNLQDFSNWLQLCGYPSWDRKEYSFAKEILEIPKETLLKIKDNGTLSVVGELKENKKVITTWAGNYNNLNYDEDGDDLYMGYPRGFRTPTVPVTDKTEFLDEIEDKILKFCDEFKVSLPYVDRIIFIATGKTLLEAEKIDLKFLTTEVFATIRIQARKNVMKEWQRIRDIAPSLNDISLHVKYDIPFPYVFSDVSALRNIRIDLNSKNNKDILV